MLRYMPKDIDIRSGIHNYDDYMNDIVNKNSLKEWWFTKSNHEEHINVIMRAVRKRAGISAKNNANFIAFNCGGIMFEAVCIATIACKDKCDVKEAEKIYNSIIEKFEIKIPREDIRILLKHDHGSEDSLQMRELEHDHLWENYQKLLQKQLEFQEHNNNYTDIINVTDMSAVHVQNKIRLIIKQYCIPKIETTTRFNPMFEHLDVVIAFGGMSKSGKSSLAEGTCRKLKSIGLKCIRLKIAYFMELASNALGSDVYQLPEQKQADELVKQLDHYLSRHYWVTAITIESLHRFESTQALKLRLGDLLQIVYVDTSLDTRMQRSWDNVESLHSKDLVKSSCGADKIKDIANCIIDNDDYTLDESINNIYEMIKDKNEKIKHQLLLNKKYSGKMNLFSHQFVLCAGTVLIQKSTREVCLIHRLDGREEWLLPKGRKNVNETLSVAAVRETYEETGYHCSLMPLTMQTRATFNSEHVQDVSRKVSDACEPFTISIRQIGAVITNQKLIFWYVAQVDEEMSREMNTQMINENFEARLVSFSEANHLLSYDDDKELVGKAFELFQNTYTMH
ncbi:unnamed protein product [Didymodactylos carnosus]|uniref:Nudix hydrolase domain-containing protein n=1 Tax=Didymodactylos carnosus TaxID=1234261 RepID=A0A815EM15_9BILA|nr:unnamed protein product [Didymodactylos carnosus]CAF1317056.1 unnamed protein product [Didymodactylos carnosus]CAF3695509.1 unnamed protein product [Didymodactylos carnosus]CAF4159757.1 unnamed protein product [Didymodactylos carnosus]